MSKKESTIQDNVKNFIKYDNNIKDIEKKLREQRKIRNSYSSNIIEFIVNNNNKTLKIGTEFLKYQETNSMTALTQSFIKNSIKEYFTINYTKMSDADIKTLSENIYNHIIKSRKNNKKFILKREQNN